MKIKIVFQPALVLTAVGARDGLKITVQMFAHMFDINVVGFRCLQHELKLINGIYPICLTYRVVQNSESPYLLNT